MIPKLVNNLLERTVNSVSMNTTVERALSSSSSTSSSTSAAFSSSSDAIGGRRNNKATVVVMACSPSSSSSSNGSRSVQSLQSKLLAARKLSGEIDNNNNKSNAIATAVVVLGQDGYPLCQYRKGFFLHLKLKNLITSTLRVTTQQATIILANFMSEQLEHDMKRNTLVNEGELTQMEADLQAEEWERVEWNKRWKLLPMKLATALTKYHAVTIILRLYEYIADKLLHGDLQLMDKLTMDPFQMSKRISLKIELKNNNSTETGRDYPIYYVGTTMTSTTFYANLLSFCADYSLHQGLLCYGYYKYYNYQRTKRLDIATSDLDSFGCNSNSNFINSITEDDKILAKDLGIKSSKLISNRGLGLICNAIGGGIGSILWPGWGTIIISSIGDSVSGMLIDDGYNKALQTLQEKQRKEEKDDINHQSQ